MAVNPFACLFAPFVAMFVIHLIGKTLEWIYGPDNASGLNPERYPPEAGESDSFADAAMFLDME